MTDAKTVCVPVETWRFHDGSVKGPADGSADLFDFITADGREYRAQKQPNFWHLVSLWRPHADSGEINWKAEYEAVCGLRIQEKMTPAQPVSPSEGEAAEGETFYGKDCPVGMVQVEFVGCHPAARYSNYGWKPMKYAFIELYVDGLRYRIDAGDIGQNCFDGKPRRGVHINYPIGAALGDRTINALNLANPGSEEFYHPASDQSDTDRMRAALKPFARYLDVLETMGGNTPRSGVYCGVSSAGQGDAEITIEDLAEARAALAEKT